jgi:hypothetical protein
MDHDQDDIVTVKLSKREVELLLRYGYPFEEAKEQLEAFKIRNAPHRLKIDSFYLTMMIADLVRSAKTLRSDAVLEEFDALCSVLESAEHDEPRVRAVN